MIRCSKCGFPLKDGTEPKDGSPPVCDSCEFKATGIDPAKAREELVEAAVRYCAIAEWFEAQPIRSFAETEQYMWDKFNEAEAKLRQAGRLTVRKIMGGPTRYKP